MTTAVLPVTGDPEADHLLVSDPLALLIGMLLDQQVPMEWAFRGPHTLQTRLDGKLDARAIAEMDPDVFEALCREKPALHRYPASMARRIQELCAFLLSTYDGRAEAVWDGVDDGAELVRRLRELPGYGEEKSKIFTAILAKRFSITPAGWDKAASPFSDEQPRSVADIDSAESLARVREWKKAMKAQGRSKAD